jgi:hypothetical protein
MRNDARPIGEDAHDQSPVAGNTADMDERESVTHDRQSHVINRGAEENARRDDADVDPTMPTGDSSLNTKI